MSEGNTDQEILAQNLNKLEELSVRLVKAMASRRATHPNTTGPGQDVYMKAAAAFMSEMALRPEKMIEMQVQLWRGTLENFTQAADKASGEPKKAPEMPPVQDKRFKNPMWEANPYFNFVKQQYLLSSKSIEETVKGFTEVDPKDRHRIEFFTQQMLDMMSPANFLGSNPDAIEKALETNGQSLVDGLENFVRDIEANQGEFAVTLTDPEAFKVGENVATAPGKVVFRNKLFELLQFSPTTENVHKTPLVIIPPWINKYYILDLKPQNSFIRYAVDQGLTVFVVSWINPDENLKDVGFDDYVEDGALAAIGAAKKLSGENKVNTIGYCIGGTLLGTTLALMAERGDKSVKSATFFTSLLDFAEPGDLGAFIDRDFIRGIEAEVESQGYLSASFMARTFSFLRANDLVYGPAVKTYLLGEKPKPFDLLFWNGDSTNLPAQMARDYLHNFYVENKLAEGELEVMGTPVTLEAVKTPVFAVATKTDHIAPWKSSFAGISQMAGKKTFILSESGHIAGIINPPEPVKYGYWTNDAPLRRPMSWAKAAVRHEGSWWPVWAEWIKKNSGKEIATSEAKVIDSEEICPAPGTYVLMKP